MQGFFGREAGRDVQPCQAQAEGAGMSAALPYCWERRDPWIPVGPAGEAGGCEGCAGSLMPWGKSEGWGEAEKGVSV